jgi:hypothetical protein
VLQDQADDPEEKQHSEGEALDAEVAHPCEQLAAEPFGQLKNGVMGVVTAPAATGFTKPITEIAVTKTVRLARVTTCGSGPERRYTITSGAPTLVVPSSTPTRLPKATDAVQALARVTLSPLEEFSERWHGDWPPSG